MTIFTIYALYCSGALVLFGYTFYRVYVELSQKLDYVINFGIPRQDQNGLKIGIIIAKRVPTPQDINHGLGETWYYAKENEFFVLIEKDKEAVWVKAKKDK